MKKKSRILLIFTLVFCQLVAFLMLAKAETTENTDEAIIAESYYLLGSQEYEERAELMTGEYQEIILSLIGNSYYEENHIGMYNVTGIRNVNILCEIGAAEYPDVLEMCNEISEDVKAYLVRYEVTAIEDTEFYANGEKYDIVFMGTVDEERKILSINAAFDSIIEEYQNGNSVNSRASLNISSGVCIPEFISVKLSSGTIVAVDFKLYCKRVAAAEVGYDGRDADYHKSGCIALKTYALYRMLTAPSDKGYHIGDTAADSQVYNPNINYSNWPNLMNAMDLTWNTFMTDSSGNCILAQYRGNDQDYNYQSSGIMVQSEAHTMAENGKSYLEILSYFYSNSNATNKTALKYKWLKAHSYVALSTGASKCSYCGYIKYNVAD